LGGIVKNESGLSVTVTGKFKNRFLAKKNGAAFICADCLQFLLLDTESPPAIEPLRM